MVKIKISKLIVSLYIFIITPVVYANDYKNWLDNLQEEAQRYGVSKETFLKTVSNLKNPNKKVLKYYNNQPEFKITFNDYYNRNINAARVSKGKKLLAKHKLLLEKISKEYFVPAEVIVSIWGIETNYGSYIVNFSIVDSLATLAYGSKRKKYFKKEFFNSLLIIDKVYISSDKMVGSWAGAMGQSQFMPSSYLEYAIDYNNDKKIDLWNSYEDIFASIANYLRRHGWKAKEYWSNEYYSDEHYLKQLKDKQIYSNKLLRKNSSNKLSTSHLDNNLYTEIKIIKKNPNKRFFLIFNNFNVIKKYNNSNFYALVVGELANSIKTK
jgi:membrane-bound lytic murein transglycosylase B